MIRMVFIAIFCLGVFGCSAQAPKTITIDAPSPTTNININVITGGQPNPPPKPPEPIPPEPPVLTTDIDGVVDRIQQFLSPNKLAKEGDAILYLKHKGQEQTQKSSVVGILLRRCSPFFVLAGMADTGDKIKLSIGKHDVTTFNAVRILIPDQSSAGTHKLSLVGKSIGSEKGLEFLCGTRKYFVQEGEQQ